MLSLFGIFLGLGLLMWLAYKGYSIVWIAPLSAAVVALFGGLNILDAYMGPYMEGLVGFVKAWFPAFMLSAIFGNLMDYTGSAKAIAVWLTKKLGSKSAIAAIIIGCAVLTYGGVSLFVVVFAIYPLALAIFREANITRKLIPGTIAAGAFTFTMTAVPGTPQIQNLIPIKYFGTSPTAAPILGLVAAAIMFFGSVFYLEWRKRKYTAQNIVFTEPEAAHAAAQIEDKDMPSILFAIIPLLLVITVLNFVPKYIGLASSDPKNIILALLSGVIIVMVLNLKKRSGFINAVGKGAQGSIGAILNTAAAVGFGSIVKTVPGFAALTGMLLSIPGSPLISLAVAVNLLAGATGSASGGMGIALEALGAKYMELATQQGINPAAFHRIASLSSGGLDTLPHNGAVLTLLNNTGMSHKDSYVDIMVTSLILPALSLIPVIILASFGVL